MKLAVQAREPNPDVRLLAGRQRLTNPAGFVLRTESRVRHAERRVDVLERADSVRMVITVGPCSSRKRIRWHLAGDVGLCSEVLNLFLRALSSLTSGAAGASSALRVKVQPSG